MATYKKYKLKPKKSIDGKTLKPEERWMVKGYLGIDPKTGLDKYTTLRGFETKRSAADAYDDAVYEFKHGLRKEETVSPTVRDVYKRWFPLYVENVKPATIKSTEASFRLYILPKFGNYLVDQLTLLDIQPWVNEICKKYVFGPTIYRRLARLLKFAGNMQWLDHLPTEMVIIPRDRKRTSNHVEDNLYSLEELRQLTDVLDQEAVKFGKAGIEHRAYFTLLISTGMRRGEALALKWKDVNFSAKKVSIYKTALPDSLVEGDAIGAPKTHEAIRQLTVGDKELGALLTWKNALPKTIDNDDWVFTSNLHPHKRVAYQAPYDWLAQIIKRNKLRPISPHGLRHTKATLMAEANINSADIAGTLGHADQRFTEAHYIHTTKDGLNNASKKYEQLLENTIWSKSGHKKVASK